MIIAMLAAAILTGPQIRNAVARDFLDPEGARFRNVTVVRAKKTGDLMACGEVNAKNAVGGFTGYKHFIVLTPTSVMLEGSKSGVEGAEAADAMGAALLQSSWPQMCGPGASLTTLVRLVQP